MPRAIRIATAALIGFLVLGSCFIAENAVHVWQHDAPRPYAASALAGTWAVSSESAQVRAADGVLLDAWLFTPAHPNGAGVILMHGVGDNRMGMTGHAQFLLRAGYTVLLPDSRGHGGSGGPIISYGILEAADIHRWADLLLRRPGVDRLYGVGQSMGAAILLESLPSEPRFRALVADCAFATFEEIAYDRLAQNGSPGRVVSWPVIHLGFIYARLRYGVNLWRASPADAVRGTHTPILLIHGANDDNIPPRHSRELHAANPTATELWEVPGAGHVASITTQPEAYQRRVTQWFDTHR